MIMILIQLGLLFSGLSLLAIGSVLGILPDMQRSVVNEHHWLTNQQFLDFFTLSRILPGPGSLIVVLIGEKVAGIAGTLVALITMFGPPAILVHIVAQIWSGNASAGWRLHVSRTLTPVTVGLTLASGIALLRGAEHGWVGYSIAAISTALLTASKTNPIFIILGGGVTMLVVAKLLGP